MEYLTSGQPNERSSTPASQPSKDHRIARLTWQTAYAGDRAIHHYEILRDYQKVGQVEHQPQTTKTPFRFEDTPADKAAHIYKLVAVDALNPTSPSGELALQAG